MHLGMQLNVLLIQLAFVLNQPEMNFKFSHKVKTTIIGQKGFDQSKARRLFGHTPPPRVLVIVFESLTRKNVIKISVGERYHLQGETECISGALLRSRIQKVVERQHFFFLFTCTNKSRGFKERKSEAICKTFFNLILYSMHTFRCIGNSMFTPCT